MKNLFFVVNQDLSDGSAHALYCARHCWQLAAANSRSTVHLMHPGRKTSRNLLAPLALTPLPNLHVHALPSLRKPRGGRGITINALYYWAVAITLHRMEQPGDILASASFPKLFCFLGRRKRLTRMLRTVYEVHQLAHLEHGPHSKAARIEHEALEGADVVFSTTSSLHDHVARQFPSKAAHVLGLACGFAPGAVPDRTRQPGEPFHLAYIGSLYEEQGVEWLVQAWPGIQRQLGFPARLAVMGGTPAEAQRLRGLFDHREGTVDICGPVTPADLAGRLHAVDGLVIPALAVGRMPYVAVTKAYDYLGLNRPIAAADLPSIREVLHPDREALLFPPGDDAGLAGCLRVMHEDGAFVSSLLENCRGRARHFSWEARARRWWEVVAS